MTIMTEAILLCKMHFNLTKSLLFPLSHQLLFRHCEDSCSWIESNRQELKMLVKVVEKAFKIFKKIGCGKRVLRERMLAIFN